MIEAHLKVEEQGKENCKTIKIKEMKVSKIKKGMPNIKGKILRKEILISE